MRRTDVYMIKGLLFIILAAQSQITFVRVTCCIVSAVNLFASFITRDEE